MWGKLRRGANAVSTATCSCQPKIFFTGPLLYCYITLHSQCGNNSSAHCLREAFPHPRRKLLFTSSLKSNQPAIAATATHGSSTAFNWKSIKFWIPPPQVLTPTCNSSCSYVVLLFCFASHMHNVLLMSQPGQNLPATLFFCLYYLLDQGSPNPGQGDSSSPQQASYLVPGQSPIPCNLLTDLTKKVLASKSKTAGL